MPDTFVKIASVTVGSGGASSMAFSSIPSTYTDLCLKISSRTDRASGSASDLSLKFNGSSTSYSDKYLYGSGSGSGSGSAYTDQAFAADVTQATMTASTFANTEIYIPNYAGSNYKSLSTDGVTENNATLTYDMLVAGLWSNTSAITSITIQSASGGNLVQYSTAVLYGIKNS